MGLFDFLKKDPQDTSGQTTQTDDSSQSNSSTLPPLPQSGFKDLTYPLPNTNIQPVNQEQPAQAVAPLSNTTIENYTFNSNQFMDKKASDPMDMMSGGAVVDTSAPEPIESTQPLEPKGDFDANAVTTTDPDGIKVTTYQDTATQPIPQPVAEIPGAALMNIEKSTQPPEQATAPFEPMPQSTTVSEPADIMAANPIPEIVPTQPEITNNIPEKAPTDSPSLPEISIGTDVPTPVLDQPITIPEIQTETPLQIPAEVPAIDTNIPEINIGTENSPATEVADTTPLIPQVQNEPLRNEQPKVDNTPFTPIQSPTPEIETPKLNTTGEMKVGLLGTNTTLNQNINTQMINLVKNLKGTLILDSNKGYSVNLIDAISRSNPELKVVGSYFKSIYTDASDEAGISIPLNNYEAFIYSDIAQKIKKIFEHSDVLIYIESNGASNMMTLITLLSMGEMYKEKLKPIILVGETIQAKIMQIYQQFGMTWQPSQNIKFATPTDDLQVIMSSLTTANNSNKVIDLRSAKEENGYLV